MFEEKIQAWINSLNLSFEFSLAKPENQFHKATTPDFKGAYIFETHTINKTEVLVFTVYDYQRQIHWTEKFAGRELSKAEVSRVEEKIDEQAEKTRIEKEKLWAECRGHCIEEWGKSLDYPGAHPYFTKKGLADHPYGKLFKVCKNLLTKTDLLVPMQNTEGEFWGYQTIHEDGQKQFALNQRLDALFFLIPGDDQSRFYLCEGVATGLSVSLALEGKFPVFVTFSAGNLLKVARALRGKHEGPSFFICADNDQWKPQVGNTGDQIATRVCHEVDGAVKALPDFSQFRTDTKPTDFNDLHQVAGIKEVARQLNQVRGERPTRIFPLGFSGSKYFFTTLRDPSIQTVREFSNKEILDLAVLSYWKARYANEKGNIKWDEARSELIDSCKKKGPFEPGKVRGRGVWRDGGKTVIHWGHQLEVDGKRCDIQDFKSQFFYEPNGAIEIPEKLELTPEESTETERLLSDLSLVNPNDYKLLMGWMFIAPLAGALEWRPHILINGLAGRGKSTILDRIIQPTFQFLHPLSSPGSTEAGIRQKIGTNAPILLVDEFDTNGGPQSITKMQAVLSLIRIASSGGQLTRGTPSGKALTFTARFVSILAGVNPPPLVEADQTRICEIEIARDHKRTDWHKYRVELDKHFPAIGSKIFWTGVSRLVNLLDSASVFQKVIGDEFGERTGQQYGIMLAGYHHFSHSEVISEEKARELMLEVLTLRKERNEISSGDDSEECLHHLLFLPVEHGNGAGREKTTLSLLLNSKETNDVVNACLANYGLRVLSDKLFISSKSPAITKHFSGTVWAEHSKSLSRLRGATRATQRVDGTTRKGITIPWERPEDEF